MKARSSVFGLAWLDVFYGPGGRTRANWRRRATARWAARLDAIVRVDAADAVIARRIRARAKPHLIKHRSDQEIFGFGARFRLLAIRPIPVLHLRTDGSSMTDCAIALERELERLRQTERSTASTAAAPPARAVANS
jgi:hypothetical protein